MERAGPSTALLTLTHIEPFYMNRVSAGFLLMNVEAFAESYRVFKIFFDLTLSAEASLWPYIILQSCVIGTNGFWEWPPRVLHLFHAQTICPENSFGLRLPMRQVSVWSQQSTSLAHSLLRESSLPLLLVVTRRADDDCCAYDAAV